MRILVVFALGSVAIAQDDGDVERLIDALVDVAEPGLGYSGAWSGSEFLPLAGSREIGSLVVGRPAPARSSALRRLVERGAAAVPALLRRLDDARPTRVPPIEAMTFVAFRDEYPFNRRTRATSPAGVNVDRAEGAKRAYRVCIGDLCFVALGQILNEPWAACRYQPSGGMVVSSPVRSARLREVVRADYRGFDAAAHRAKLLADLTEPDHEQRRIGAVRRLAFYYPDGLEKILLAELKRPTWNAHVVHAACREQLYKLPTAAARRARLERLLTDGAAGTRDGVVDMLFDDLFTQENLETGRWTTSHRHFEDQPRRLLIELFGYPDTVRSADRPWPRAVQSAEQARFLAALVHAPRSRRIDAAALALLQGAGDDDSLAIGCMKLLLGRGHDGPIRTYCERRIGQAKGYDPELRAILESLPR